MKRSPKLFSLKYNFTRVSVVLAAIGLGISGFPNYNAAQAVVKRKTCVPSPFVVCASGFSNDTVNIDFFSVDTSVSPSSNLFFEDAVDLNLRLIGNFLKNENLNTTQITLTLLDGDLQASQIAASKIRDAENDSALTPFGVNLGDLILATGLSEKDKSNFLNNGAVKYEATFNSSPATLTRFIDTDGDSLEDTTTETTASGNATKFTFFVPLPSADVPSFISDLSSLKQFSQIQAVVSQDGIPGNPDTQAFNIYGFVPDDGVISRIPLSVESIDTTKVPEPLAPASLLGFGILNAILLVRSNKRSKVISQK